MHRKLNRIYYEVKEPTLKWDDIGGLAGPKRIVREMVSLPLQKPEMLAKHHLTIPSGVLIWGPLGIGITMLAEAAATEAGVSYVYVSGQEMLGKPDELKQAFHDAKHEAPCVLYISDTEWLAPRAGSDYEWGPAFLRNQGAAEVDEIEFRFFEDPATRAIALESDQADVMGEIPPQDATRVEADNGLTLLPVAIPGQPLQLFLNTTRPPTDDKAVRTALLHAVDRPTIARWRLQPSLDRVGPRPSGRSGHPR